MNYEDFVKMEIKRTEGSLAAMKNGEMFYCAACNTWMDARFKRVDPLGSWPICDDCLERQGIDPENVGDAARQDYGVCVACGKPAVGETDNGFGHGSYPYCEEHRL
jgi:hypothetical protein